MATKIIHILKSDKFEDILSEFQNSNAGEVIFIFPHNGKFGKEENHFKALDSEAKKNNKTVTIMASSNEIRDFAQKYNFQFIPAPQKRSSKIKMAAVNSTEDDTIRNTQDLRSESKDIGTDIKNVEEDMPHDESIHDKDRGHNLEILKNEDDKESDESFPESTPPETEGGHRSHYGEIHDYSDNTEETKELLSDNQAEGAEYSRGEVAARLIRHDMSDIVGPKEEKDVKIKKTKEKIIPLEIRRQSEDLEYSRKSENVAGIKGLKDIKNKRLEDIEKMWLNKFKKPLEKLTKTKKGGVSKKSPLIFLGSSIIILLLILYTVLGSAQIVITPRTQELDFQIKFSASSQNSAVDSTFNTIPGEFFSISKTSSITIKTSGQKEVSQKARGIITVFNNFSSSTQPLVATTRFETLEGLIFRTPKRIVVPGATTSNGVITAQGELKIEVIADGPGEEYNIGPTKFSIPGFKGSAKFQGFYAQSEDSMDGGLIGLANVVTEKDFNETQEKLKRELFEEINQELNKKSSGLEILSPMEPETISETQSHKINEATTQLTLTMSAKSSTIAFNEKDIIELINSFIQKTGDLELVEESLDITYENPKINEKDQTISADLLVRGKAGLKIDVEQLRKNLAGLEEKQIKELIGSMNEIESAKISLSPFWVKRIPENLEKIKIEVKY